MDPSQSPKPPHSCLLTYGPLAIRDAPLPVDTLDLSVWMPPSVGAPASAATPSSADALATLAVEAWRIKGRLARLSESVPGKELRPLQAAVAKMEEAFSGAHVQVEDPQGQPFHDGDPYEVLLFEPNPSLSRPTVLQTIKPAVLVAGKLARRAEVVVGTPGEAPKLPPAGGLS